MAKCSQCGKDVSLFERDIVTGACSQCRNVGARPATLGCGTLILIGIVVALFTRTGFKNIEQRLTRLEHSIDSLQIVIAAQTDELRQLRAALEPAPKPSGTKSK